jgi:transcriptional regulator NrdR family protein
MVCIYCGSPTSVNNSRLQRHNNHVWRRRSCTGCKSVFTTIERPDLSGSFVVGTSGAQKGQLKPFNRDKLFLAIYECCKHRPDALEEASSLTQTVINQLVLEKRENGLIERAEIAQKTFNSLERLDTAAAAIFAAYHKDYALTK